MLAWCTSRVRTRSPNCLRAQNARPIARFLVQGDRRISFGGFYGGVDAARKFLGELGIQPGDRVMLFGYNSPEWAVALWIMGAIPILGNRWWSAHEIEYGVALLAPRHILADTALAASITTVVSDIAELRSILDDTALGVGAIGGVSSVEDVDEDAAAVILLTSGSSGRVGSAPASTKPGRVRSRCCG
jgi:long-chain acyl-CoA synthetase